MDQNKLKYFHDGEMEYSDMKEILVDIIKNYLGASNDNIVIFENSSVESNDNVISSFDSNLLFFGQEVYHYLTVVDLDVDKIKVTISEASNAWQNVVIFTKIKFNELLNKVEISEEMLKTLTFNSSKIIVDAYDLDGFMISDL
jgi:hypothetical protein